jgi:nucleotide-binding universal stress UspA family protein
MVLGSEGSQFVRSNARRAGDTVIFGGTTKVNARERSNEGGSRVLVVGFDQSSASQNALAYAIGIAGRDCCDVVVVQVNPTAVYGSTMDGGLVALPGVLTSVSGRLDAEVVARLEEVVPGRWRLEVRHGDPAVELERISEELRSDVIVIGRSRGAVRHPLGSVTGRLIRRAKRPVIVVP